MKDLLIAVAKKLVSKPEAVVVEEAEPTEDGTIVLTLTVDAEDKGRVIGKQGRIAKAIRTVMRSAATKQNKKVNVEIL